MRPAFETDEPIDDPLTVLDLLCGPYWERMTTREVLRAHRRRDNESYIRIGHHHDFTDSTYYDFRVTERVIDHLLAGGYLQGKPQWGYTDMNELTASDAGKSRIRELREELKVDEKFRSEYWFREAR